MLLLITNAETAARIVGHPRQAGQVCRYDEETTRALIEAGCAELHGQRREAQPEQAPEPETKPKRKARAGR